MPTFISIGTGPVESKPIYEHDADVVPEDYLAHECCDRHATNASCLNHVGMCDQAGNECLNCIFDTFKVATACIADQLHSCIETSAQFMQIQGKTVHFSDEVQVIVTCGGQCEGFWLEHDAMKNVLRQCWTLEGNGSSYGQTCAILNEWTRDARDRSPSIEVSERNSRSSDAAGRPTRQLHGQVDSDSAQECWTQVRNCFPATVRVGSVETWYLRPGHIDVCPVSKTVRITPQMDLDQFQQACREVWKDVIVPGRIAWNVVRDPPNFHISTKAQVILRQGDVEGSLAHLLHWDAWPLLRKTRATIVFRDEALSDVLDRVRYDGCSLRGNDRYGAYVVDQGFNVHLEHHERINIPSATVLYAFVQHVPSNASDTSYSDVGSSVDRSTNCPDSEDEDDGSDEVSWVTSHLPQVHFDHHGPYPWEVGLDSDEEIDDALEEEEDVPQIHFAREDQFQMLTHANFLQSHAPANEPQWVAVTFAIGLVSLGRRDVDFTWNELDTLPDKVAHLWADHVVRGTAQMYFVAPQPEGLHVRRYLVFIVSIKYGNDAGREERAVLVREMSSDHEVVSDRPYPALLEGFMSPPAIVSELGHHECFPIGIRDCYVRMGGRWLDKYVEAYIQNGNLCDVFIEQFPSYVEQAENSLIGAETMFQLARSCVESSPVPVLFTLRFHGVSPQNRPLGARDLLVNYDDLKLVQWINQARAIWPFVDFSAALAFVPSITAEIGEVHDRPIFHFVLSYVTDLDSAPVLVRQLLHEVHSFKEQRELWAVNLPRTADESQVRCELNRRPFWFHPQVRTHIRFLEEDLRLHDNEWKAGDVLDLRMNVMTLEFMLVALREMEMRNVGEGQHLLEEEQASLLQMFKYNLDAVDPEKTRFDDSGFAEICIHCHDDCVQDLALAAKSEGNLDLRNAIATNKVHLDNSCDGCQVNDEQNGPWPYACIQPGDVEQVVVEADTSATPTDPKWYDNEVQLAQKIVDDLADQTPCKIKPNRKVLLSLDATVPLTAQREIDPEDVSFQWFERCNWEDYCMHCPSVQLRDLPDGLRVKPSTYHVLTVNDSWEAVPVMNLVFVDGSYKDGRATWSIVVVKSDGWNQSFHGCAFGQVETCPDSATWCGADHGDNVSAELTALILAQNWVLKQHDSTKSVILPDLMLSKMIATMQHSSKVHPRLVKLARIQATWLQHKCSYVHVKGHAAFAWNELADTLAAFALNAHIPNPESFPNDLHELAGYEDDLNWMWMQNQACSMTECLPVLFDEKFARIPASQRRVSTPVRSAEVGGRHCRLDLNVITANVLAMDPKSECQLLGRQNAARTIRMDAQCHELKAALVGVQEARTEAGRFHSEHYHIVSGGADFSNTAVLGCELWFHKTLPIAADPEGRKISLADAQVIVQHADPRRLCVQFDLGVAKIDVLVLHVPSVKASESEEGQVEGWWRETSQIVDRLCSDNMRVVLIDANAPLGEDVSEYVGGFGAEKHNLSGELLENFIHEKQWFAPTTMEWCHQGPTATWTHPRGHKMRRDYIFVDHQAFQLAQQSFVVGDYDNTFAHEDHLPVVLRLAGWFQLSGKEDRIVWDFDKFKDPIRCKQFAQAVETLPIPTWDVSVDHHCRLYETQLLQLGRQYFEKTEHTRHRPVLTEATMSLIGLKRSALDFGRRTGALFEENFKNEIKQIEAQVRKLVWKDSQAFYDQLLNDIECSHGLGDFRTLFRTLIRFGSRRSKQSQRGRPLPILRKPDGEFAKNFAEQQSVWVQQFSEIEAGTIVSWDALESMDRPGLGLPVGMHDLQMFPNHFQVEQTISKLKRQKATGPNQIPTDLLKAAPAAVAKQLVCLYSKAAAHAKEPTDWKGGFVAPLYKKGPVMCPKSYRSIFISDYTAKIYHASLRSQLLQVWQQGLDHLQLGGRPLCGTDSAHHWIQVHTNWTSFHGLPQGLLFFDIKSAFYMVLRQALTDVQDTTNAAIVALVRLGIHPRDVKQMMEVAARDSATRGISEHGARILKDALTNTYFQVKGCDFPVVTHRGTRPGDPLADVLFNLTMQMILRDTKNLIGEKTDAAWLGQVGSTLDVTDVRPLPCPAYLDVSYVDDVVFAIHGFCNAEVCDMATICVDAFQQAAKKRGLLINFDPGKTEVVLTLRGKGTRAVKQQIAADHGCLPWTDGDQSRALRVVTSYKHLGTWLQEKGKHTKEVRSRAATACSSWAPLARPFYRKKQISPMAKQRVFEAMTYSRLLFNAHVWTGVQPSDLVTWQNSIRVPLYSLVRGVTRGIPPFKLSVETLAGLGGFVTPTDALHAARLRYIKRFVQQGHQMLWDMLWDSRMADGSWVSLCMSSFRWLCRFCPKKLPLQGDASFLEWYQVVALGNAWKGKVRAALRSCRQYRKAYAVQHVWELQFLETLKAKEVQVAESRSDSVEEVWECEQCQMTFKNKRALAMHSVHKHGYKALVKHFAAGDTCPCAHLQSTRSGLPGRVTGDQPVSGFQCRWERCGSWGVPPLSALTNVWCRQASRSLLRCCWSGWGLFVRKSWCWETVGGVTMAKGHTQHFKAVMNQVRSKPAVVRFIHRWWTSSLVEQ